MFITADQLFLHALGDYVLQSDWMAQNKTKSGIPCAVHALTYSLPFIFLTKSITAIAFIGFTHFIIDRWRLARYVCWAKNWISPTGNLPWVSCQKTGYTPSTPDYMAIWLMIIVDNLMHITCNATALYWL